MTEQNTSPTSALHLHSHQSGSCTKCGGGRLVYIGQGEYRECNACVDKDASPAWRCFHCDETFTDEAAAREHFGASQLRDPMCSIDAARVREIEDELQRHREDDTDLHREIHRLHAQRHTECQRAEEKGYERGMRDATQLKGSASPAARIPSRVTEWHDLKADAYVFEEVITGRKAAEIRFDDRGYQVGHVLHLRETRHTGAEMKAGAPLEYTGREAIRVISHIQRGYGLGDGWVCLSFDAAMSTTPPAAEDRRAA